MNNADVGVFAEAVAVNSQIGTVFFQTTYGLVAWFEYLDDVLPVHKAGKV